jgi:hypothetical protein
MAREERPPMQDETVQTSLSGGMIDFSDESTRHGQFYAQHRTEVPAGWWTKRHAGLGESPFSALCADRFDEVKEVVEALRGCDS